MRRCFDPFVLLLTAMSAVLPAPPHAYAQNPNEVKRLL
jgi:hypothetical protein